MTEDTTPAPDLGAVLAKFAERLDHIEDALTAPSLDPARRPPAPDPRAPESPRYPVPVSGEPSAAAKMLLRVEQGVDPFSQVAFDAGELADAEQRVLHAVTNIGSRLNGGADGTVLSAEQAVLTLAFEQHPDTRVAALLRATGHGASITTDHRQRRLLLLNVHRAFRLGCGSRCEALARVSTAVLTAVSIATELGYLDTKRLGDAVGEYQMRLARSVEAYRQGGEGWRKVWADIELLIARRR